MKLSKQNGKQAGFTLLEVVISSVVLSIALMAASAAFSSDLIATEKAKRITTGAVFLNTVTEDVLAQDFDNLLALNGNQIFDGATLAASEYRVDLTVFLADLDLMQVQAALIDLQSNRELGRVGALRRRE